ncbi:hypothetical protein LJC53_03675 [Bacteroidales bacterium OttesenSCG-928-C03]|nr:hypothetical protein [Bacteroidales bacterium OttesenSCG-928-C03]MDL2325939.1 hypothetical protein [Bacteroidales bacterium OttesenSCG-928-A14]
MFDIPILLVLYNKVEDTHNLFQVLKQLKPAKLYVAGDGAVHGDRIDYVNCIRSRAVIMPEWACEKKEFFKEEHLGKSEMITQAITWFFKNEPEGIILFDDTIPNMDFFYYCKELLGKYREDKRIVHINGSNLQRKNAKNDGSYYFSAYPLSWGFATWADRWKGFDLQMTLLEGENINKMMSGYISSPKEKLYWLRRYNILRRHKLDIWEYQYIFYKWYQKGLSITPSCNLVTNVGLKNRKRKIRKLMRETKSIMPLSHPKEVVQSKGADQYAFKHIFNKAFIKMFSDWFNEYLLGKEKKL